MIEINGSKQADFVDKSTKELCCMLNDDSALKFLTYEEELKSSNLPKKDSLRLILFFPIEILILR